MPHLLVAGATGSGKSVCLNAIVTSLIYRHGPGTLRFLFIDPKMLELSVYQGLPHLERPVVTTARKAETLLNDAVGEMENRYRRLAAQNVRNIVDYNARAGADGKLPYIVIMVDELADLMMSNTSTRTETLITRLAQMARAVGIHLILSTQRPSVDVITGLIKANFPARIAFQVATRVDSRTILDGNGAEKLLGKGDLLFLQPGQPEPLRIHGALITSEETSRLMDFMRVQKVEIPRIDNFDEEQSAKREADFGSDPLLREAAEVVVRHKQGSVSLLQRRLGVGYQRAARLIDQLEEKKIVGIYDGSKAREVLVDEVHLQQMLKNL
jgi:S-DNA-T family DNA segregation ATPase FtsK/SpoIIIE